MSQSESKQDNQNETARLCDSLYALADWLDDGRDNDESGGLADWARDVRTAALALEALQRLGKATIVQR